MSGSAAENAWPTVWLAPDALLGGGGGEDVWQTSSVVELDTPPAKWAGHVPGASDRPRAPPSPLGGALTGAITLTGGAGGGGILSSLALTLRTSPLPTLHPNTLQQNPNTI
jgi:hypothetical protein